MFQSIQRRPIALCEISVCAVRLQSSNSLRQGIGKGKSETTSWMGRRMGLLLSWLQRSGVGTSEKVRSDKKKQGLLSIFANHCSFVTGQRLRRAYQIGELYSNLYSERTRWTLVGSIWRRLQSKHASTGKLVAALAGVFMWEDEKVRDEELHRKNRTLCVESLGQRACLLCLEKIGEQQTAENGEEKKNLQGNQDP